MAPKTKTDKTAAAAPAKAAKKEKDPNAPKKPKSSFIFFTQDKRQSVLDSNPGIKFTEVTREIAKLWEVLDEKGRTKYADLAKKDKARYEAEKAAYEVKKGKK